MRQLWKFLLSRWQGHSWRQEIRSVWNGADAFKSPTYVHQTHSCWHGRTGSRGQQELQNHLSGDTSGKKFLTGSEGMALSSKVSASKFKLRWGLRVRTRCTLFVSHGTHLDLIPGGPYVLSPIRSLNAEPEVSSNHCQIWPKTDKPKMAA